MTKCYASESAIKAQIQFYDHAFSRPSSHTSHPFPVKKGQKVAVRVVSQFGEEMTNVLEVELAKG